MIQSDWTSVLVLLILVLVVGRTFWEHSTTKHYEHAGWTTILQGHVIVEKYEKLKVIHCL